MIIKDDAFLSNRIKLLDCQKEMIPSMIARGCSINKVAKMYKVSRPTIDYIVNPEAKARMKERAKESAKKNYNTESNTKAILKSRKNKTQLLNMKKNNIFASLREIKEGKHSYTFSFKDNTKATSLSILENDTDLKQLTIVCTNGTDLVIDYSSVINFNQTKEAIWAS